MTTLTFQNTTLSVINQHNQIWLTATELAKALGYKQADSVTRIYNRNSDEFNDNMTAIIKNPQAVNLTVRIFSLRGCHLIGMLSHTKVAKDFRKWVLDILDKEIAESQNQQQNLPLVEEQKYTFEHTKEQGLRLVSLWHSAYRMTKILGELEPALSMLGSTFAPMAHSCSKEYQITLALAHKELTRMLDGVEVSPRENAHFYKVLSDLRQWQPKGYLRKIS